jgi:hypothetical protein
MRNRGNANIRDLTCLTAVALAGALGCGKHALAVHRSDDAGPISDATAVDLSNGPVDGSGTSPDRSIEADVPDAEVVDADAPDAPQAPDAASMPEVRPNLDACLPFTCHGQSGCDYGDYCGVIGDGCGGTLNCGACTKPGWTCSAYNTCTASSILCVGITCTTANGNRYCGDIGDGCGGTLHCGDCPKPGWICQDGMCVGPPAVCTPSPCEIPNGPETCGIMCDDGCGRAQDCGSCTRSGWLCDTNNLCKGPVSCPPLACSPTSGGQYCGAIGDGCGGTLICGHCTDGSICGERIPGVCGSSADLPAPPIPPSPPPPPPVFWPCLPPPPPVPCLPPPPPPFPV